MRSTAMLFIFLATPVIAYSETYYVPDDYPSIQAAISDPLVKNGDTILVRQGTYVENINFLGKAIVVKSSEGPEGTIIDGKQSGSVATFENEEGQDSVLDGFTIQNGRSIEGGGVSCEDGASPTISNNIIIGNVAYGFIGSGGGISCSLSSPVILNNIIEDNISSYGGGGIACAAHSHCTIRSNTIRGNSAFIGGGIGCIGSSPIITNNTIYGNYVQGSQDAKGGGIHCSGSSAVITNNTIHGNSAMGPQGCGGGISCSDHSFPRVTNTILWNNDAATGREICLQYINLPCTLTISFSDVEGGQGSVEVQPGSTLNWGAGMIDSDPCFVDSAHGDFHLFHDSPCRDSGDNFAPSLPEEDFEGDPRPDDYPGGGISDIGADEFYTHLYYTGDAVPGGSVEFKITGVPETSLVILWIGSGVLGSPWNTPYGDWWLLLPIVKTVRLHQIPLNGVLILPVNIPPGAPSREIPMQAGVGIQLTNLMVMKVES